MLYLQRGSHQLVLSSEVADPVFSCSLSSPPSFSSHFALLLTSLLFLLFSPSFSLPLFYVSDLFSSLSSTPLICPSLFFLSLQFPFFYFPSFTLLFHFFYLCSSLHQSFCFAPSLFSLLTSLFLSLFYSPSFSLLLFYFFYLFSSFSSAPSFLLSSFPFLFTSL